MLRYDQLPEIKGVNMRRNDRLHKFADLNKLILYAHLSGVSIVQNIQSLFNSIRRISINVAEAGEKSQHNSEKDGCIETLDLLIEVMAYVQGTSETIDFISEHLDREEADHVK